MKKTGRWKWLGGLLLVALVGAAGLAWVGRTPVLTWYYVRGLTLADEAERDAWARHVVGLDEAAVPRLLDALAQDDPRVCLNVQAALAALADRWGRDDPRRVGLTQALHERFGRLRPCGQDCVLQLVALWLQEAPGDAMVQAATRLLGDAVRVQDRQVRLRTLELALALPAQPGPSELTEVRRELAQAGLKDEEPAQRARAIQVAQQVGQELVKAVVPLLDDPAPEVRRAAMLAVGPTADAVATDDLLRWLHDPDEDVRRLCEAALRGPRGLPDRHVHLGRLITDRAPRVRLQVLESLRQASDLEPGIWLRRLTHDPAPEVRVAAMRAAVESLPDTSFDLSDRLDQMAHGDSSPTVSTLAQYYLSCSRRQQGEGKR